MFKVRTGLKRPALTNPSGESAPETASKRVRTSMFVVQGARNPIASSYSSSLRTRNAEVCQFLL